MSLLAVIPARGGSQGLPGKNLRPLAGLPLIAHSISLAKLCPEIDRVIVSTDDQKIAEVSKRHGADVPFLRPAALAASDTPMWPVLRHALDACETGGARYEFLLLLDPTSPTRLPADVAGAFARLRASPEAVGIVAASEPEFSPLWHSVTEKDGWMSDFIDGAARYARRQDVPRILRINGLVYIWRTDFMRTHDGWRNQGPHLLHETPDLRASSIDTLEQFQKTEALLRSGLIKLPWLKEIPS